ncbi:hypothetical protein F900_01500 [Acinetobacter modestus]|uniref:Uncharacterized protein n=1 Tax=Acinetobacter modestus TaxID=1776740 RepID=N9NID8_9GAMM|nr:hypothetical protein F900_01500 [Acinetobacter modestus]
MRQIKSRIRMVWDGKSKIKDDLLLWHINAYFRFKSSNGEKSAFFLKFKKQKITQAKLYCK